MPGADAAAGALLTSASLGAALRDLRDLPGLKSSPLIRLALVTEHLHREGRPDTTIERARSLRQVLLATIQELQPAASVADYADPQWSDFLILYDQYERERSPELVRFDINSALVERRGSQHTISLRTYARRNERARRRLLERLQEKEAAAQRPGTAAVALSENACRVSGPLTWACLWQAARQVSQDSLTLRLPRNWTLPYVQRQDLLCAFREFLISDSACFVLTGRSGVGKSSFLRSLLDECGDDVCLLAFDAAQLKPELDLTEQIAQAIRARLGLPQGALSDFWTEVNQLPGLDQRRIVLVLDEINENTLPAQLLRQANDLVGSWPWLKITLTSRPEAWRAMWRTTPLRGRHFYVPTTSGSAAQNERPALSAWDLQPFSPQEARAAYARYQDVFHLETDYEALPRRTQELVREPLILWLIAATYDAGAVALTLRRDRLVDNYLGALLATRRLHPEDCHMLVQELIPRIARTPGPHAQQLTSESLADDPDLLRRIFGGGARSDRAPIDASFERLVDAGIFVSYRHQSPAYVELRRGLIYEQLVGQRMYMDRIKDAADPAAACRALIETADRSTDAWGAVQWAVYLALRDTPERVQRLAFSGSAEVAQMVRGALLALVESEPQQARRVLRWIAARCQQWRARWSPATVRPAAALALAAASASAAVEVFDAMLTAPDDIVNEMAVNAVYFWGKQHPDRALDVVELLAARVTHSGWAIDRRALNATLFLIPLLAIDCWEHEGLHSARLERLLSLCGEIVARIERRPVGRAFRSLVRSSVAPTVVATAYQLLQEGVSLGAMDDAISYQRFFSRPLEVRAQARAALTWVDRHHGALADAMDLLHALYASQDHLSAQIADAIIMGRGIHHPSAVRPVLDVLLDTVSDPGHGIQAHVCSCWCECVIRQDQVAADALDHMGRLVTRALDACSDGYGVVVREGHFRRYRPLHYYMRLWVRVHPGEPVDLVEYYLRKAGVERDTDLLLHVIASYADVSNLGNHCGAMLRSLAPYVSAAGAVRECLAESLAAIRGFRPELVDGFLLEAEAPKSLQDVIDSKTTKRPRRWHYIGLLPLVQDFIAYAPSSVLQPILGVWREALGADAWAKAAFILADGMVGLLRRS